MTRRTPKKRAKRTALDKSASTSTPKERNAYILNLDGTTVAAPEKMTLEAMYTALNCQTVELLRFEGFELWCDEEGLLKKRPQLNPIARDISNVPIVGTAYLRVNAGYVLEPGLHGFVVRALQANRR